MKLEPLPQDSQGRQLCEIFEYLWQPIVADAPEGNATPAWTTETRYPMRPRVLWNLHQDAGKLVGVRFGNTTTYALLDIDAGSQHRNLDSIDHIRAALETIGITRSVLVRSSWSGGLHLYIPLPKPVKTFDLALALRRTLEAQGFDVKPGQLEIFPNTKRFGAWWLNEFTEYNAHRLPLQPGSGSRILDDDLNPTPGGDRLHELFRDWEMAAGGQDIDQLNSALAQAKTRFKETKHPYRNLARAAAWRRDLEIEISEGWTGHGQTNTLLKAIACYGVVFERLEGDDLVEYVQRMAVSRPGYGQWCRHRHEIHRRCKVWAIAAGTYYWPFGGQAKHRDEEPDTINQNDARAQEAQGRIKHWVVELANLAALPNEITDRARALCEAARVSFKTLYRYLSLWHPDHWQRCKTVDPARDTDDLEQAQRDRCDRAKPSDRGEFYTLGGDMKRSAALNMACPPENINPVRGGSPGGVIHRLEVVDND